MSIWLGVDIGGTFTDIVLYDEAAERIYTTKTPSTPAAFEEGVLDGIERVLSERGERADAVTFLSHGTTVGTNAVLEDDLPKIGLVTNAGLRDVVEIGDQTRPDLYDLFTDKPPALVPRHLRKGVPGRLNHVGNEIEPLDESAASAAIDALADEGVESIVVSFLYSYLDESHERRVGSLIEERTDGTAYTLSSEVYPEIREYERTITTILNEAVKVEIREYIENLETDLASVGIDVPLNIMHIGGGVLRAGQATENAIRTVLSGPAAGAVATRYASEREAYSNAIGMDMGGTSTDVSIVRDGELIRTTEGTINDLPIKTPMIDLNTVGAGGGSVTWIDDGGALRVGPESAGARPGPICYGHGGTQPTLTDANLLLGRLDPDAVLGGDVELVRDRTRELFRDRIAEPLGQSVEEAAQSVVDVSNASLTREIRRVTVERGEDPASYALVAFGGAGPLHAVPVADRLDMDGVLVPNTPGVFSASGLLVADVRVDESHSYRAADVDHEVLTDQFDELVTDVSDQLSEQGFQLDDVVLDRALDMRYRGQSYELTVSLPEPADAPIDGEMMASARERFHEKHRRLYGHARPDEPIEVVILRVSGVVESPTPDYRVDPADGDPRRGTRNVYFADRGFVETDIYARPAVPTGDTIDGPAIVEESSSTTLVPPESAATVTQFRNLLIE
ncbi:hydantoinase/oxoprolinase family protein [Halovivax cerinus]|uniref:Hydantoinase/oxoprolinase family protein n=1 Tax=Halovivax cerinus TaxID=1487865 RepID=A0ABD5NRY9_9EURY|nr:hydantoinase/oxoprolinase family protein [Halovivax cerinus]